MNFKRLISTITVISIMFSMLTSFGVLAAETETCSCDFTKLVKDGQDTQYGNAEDIIQIDEYTTAYLTYEGTYVDANGAVNSMYEPFL